MRKTLIETIDKMTMSSTQTNDVYPMEGLLADSGDSGLVKVTVNGSSPFSVRNFSAASSLELMKKANTGKSVVVSLFNGNPAAPIITGVEESLFEQIILVNNSPKQMILELEKDGSRTIIRGDSELTFQCGRGSITINKSGQIIIRGTDVLNLSEGSNRIRGGSIELN